MIEIDEKFVKDKFVVGLVQYEANDDFSNWVLEAYKRVQDENTVFLLMGGSPLYKQHALQLGIETLYWVPLSYNENDILKFLSLLDVFLHGRTDGESRPEHILLALKQGVPIITHGSAVCRDHLKLVTEGGIAHGLFDCYAFELWNFKKHHDYREWMGSKAKEQYQKYIETHGIIEKNVKEEWLDEWLDE